MESTSEVMSNTVGEKTILIEATSENTSADKQLDEKEVLAEPVKVENNETATENKEIETIEPISAKHNDSDEIVEEIVEVQEEEESNEDDNVDAKEGVEQNITEEIIETPNGEQIKTTTITTVKKSLPASTTTVVTNTSLVNQDKPSVTTVTKTTTTSDEVINETNEIHKQANEEKNSEVKQDKNEEKDSSKNEEDESESEEEETEAEDDDEVEEDVADEARVKEEIVNEEKESVISNHQQQSQDQQENETQSQQPIKINKEETVVDAPTVIVTQTNQPEDKITNKQENLNNTIKDIISNIDDNIQAQENIAALKERELELIKKQQELAKEIEQQKLLAQKLANENYYKQQLNNNNYVRQESDITSKPYQPLIGFEETQDNNIYSRKSETFESRESTNVSKKIDLHKIFTPATDAEEILPKNRKLYASSAFYSPSLHPTVEDQVELARRISHSLSDISNHQSRGQSMYVNRKKRSVKWIHEGSGQDGTENENVTTEEEFDQEERKNDTSHQKNTPLKFLMNPSGQMRDIHSLHESINTETGLLSPDVSAEVMNALQAQRGKGAELFAKRRKVAEKWVVDEYNVGAQSPSGLSDYHQYQQPKTSTSPSILPAYTDAAKHRVLLNLHQEQLLEKYAKPGLKVVQTPWEAALNSGSASAAFVEEQKLSPYPTSTLTPSPTPQIFDASQGGIPIPSASNVSDSYNKTFSNDDYQIYQTPQAAPQHQTQHERQYFSGTNSQRELAYKPSIPQGWRAPSMSLPKDLYMPKEIPLQSYAPPPVANIPSAVPPYSSSSTAAYETNQYNTYKPTSTLKTETSLPLTKPYVGSSNFPVSKPYQQGFSSAYGSTQPPKQQYLPPQSYQKVPQNTNQNVPQVNFNPSPLPYDKLAKFENPTTDEGYYGHSPSSRNSYLNVRGSKVRNSSPAPFTGIDNRAFTPSSDSHYYGGTPSVSPRQPSSTPHYSGHNTPNLSPPSLTSNQLLNAPSYNTSARGWGCGGGATSGYHYQPNYLSATKPQIVNASSMPYTDF